MLAGITPSLPLLFGRYAANAYASYRNIKNLLFGLVSSQRWITVNMLQAEEEGGDVTKEEDDEYAGQFKT